MRTTAKVTHTATELRATPSRLSWAVALVLTSGGLVACPAHDDLEADTAVLEDVEEDTGPIEPDIIEFEVVEDVAPEVVEPPKPGELGYPCDDNLDCNSGFCIQTADGRQCTRACVDECPTGWECRQSPGQDAIFICLPRFIHLCDPCRESAECNGPGQSGNYCLPGGDNGSFCGASCVSNDDCPEGYTCNDQVLVGGLEVKQCMPAGGAPCECSDYAKQRQAATDCAVTNEHGSCGGTRFCLQQGLSLCDAETPFPESCDGLDNNCNDRVDDFPPDYVCNITNEFGTCKGAGTCVDGVETCVGEAAKPELCDSIDNDCDGDTDEELCDDQNPCTRDFCNSEGVCQNVADDTLTCDDGSVCTQTDLCRAGVCQGFNPIACGDGNPCMNWTCDPAAGCLSSFNTNPCEDGEPCTINDRCSQGVCVAGNPNPCDDGQECTLDSCQQGVGCRHSERPNGTACGSGPSPNGCTTGTCSNGACVGTPIREGMTCSYGSTVPACKDARCQAGSCALVNQPAGTVCGNRDICPPCVDAIGSIFGCCFGLLEETVNLRCSSTGTCSVQDPSSATCGSTNCGGACAGSCVPACGIGICLQ